MPGTLVPPGVEEQTQYVGPIKDRVGHWQAAGLASDHGDALDDASQGHPADASPLILPDANERNDGTID